MNQQQPCANPFAGLQVQAGGADPLPPAAYFARFVGVEAFSNDKVTDKLRWTWEVVSGPHKGRQATALTDKKLTPANHAGRLIAGLIGRPLKAGDDLGQVWAEMAAGVGKTWCVTQAPGAKGGKPSVQHVAAPPAQD